MNVAMFGNAIPLRVNFLYTLHGAAIKARGALQAGKYSDAALTAKEATMVAGLRRNGYAWSTNLFDHELVKRIGERASHLLNEPAQRVDTLASAGLVRIRRSMLEIPELEEVVLAPGIKRLLTAYFHSSYSVFSCDAYRTGPAEFDSAAQRFTSLKWHLDNCPSPLLKIMVYLTDVNQNTGPLSVVDKPTSRELKRDGFWERDTSGGFHARINRAATPIVGPAGTTILVSTHSCIHKATLPHDGHRDVAVFLVQPAWRRLDQLTRRDLEEASFNFGYCVNPFTGAPLRRGEE